MENNPDMPILYFDRYQIEFWPAINLQDNILLFKIATDSQTFYGVGRLPGEKINFIYKISEFGYQLPRQVRTGRGRISFSLKEKTAMQDGGVRFFSERKIFQSPFPGEGEYPNTVFDEKWILLDN